MTRSSTLAAAFAFAAAAIGTGCASAPPATSTAPTAAEVRPDPRLQPPPFRAAPPATSAARDDARTASRRAILDAAWRTVRDKHYDRNLGGVDWNAVRRRYEPLALGAPDQATFYRQLNAMLAELGQSHMMITGPGASDEATETEGPPPAAGTGANGPGASPTTSSSSPSPSPSPAAPAAPASPPPAPSPSPARPTDIVEVTDVGDPGLVVRVIEDRPIVTSIREGSSAERHGIRPGFVVTHIAGRTITSTARGPRALRPVEERFAVRRRAQHLLQGPVGTKVTVRYLDNRDRPGEVILDREAEKGPLRQIGHLPPLYPEARVAVIDRVGLLGFNLFLIDPLLAQIKSAVDRFRQAKVRGVILDLRGNPGGLGAMAIPVASEFVSAPTELGALQFRDFSQVFTARPSLGRVPFQGPLVVLTDEGTASASEILAAGLQEAGRARVFGDVSLGAVLPSVVEALPDGAVMQYVVADFKTPKGILLEGRGVQPDRRIVETRAAFQSGHDPVLDAALDAIRGWKGAP